MVYKNLSETKVWRINFFLLLIAFTLCFTHRGYGKEAVREKPLEKEEVIFRFGVVADPQYADADDRIGRFYRESLSKLEKAVGDINNSRVDFTIILGDLVDRSYADFPPVLERLKALKQPFYCTTGNHDYGGVTDNEELFKLLNMPSEYYAFVHKGWKFIMLNTNELASYAHIEGTWKEKEYELLMQELLASKRKNKAGYNGGISSRQMKWLKEELDKARKNDERVIVCTHHPLCLNHGFTALNDRSILETLSGNPCVKMVVSGHHHAGAFGICRKLPCVTIEGMVETKEENAYVITEIYADKIIIKGRGRAKSYEFTL